jgi:putative spermidine/putrescine transport system permease protein
MRKLARGVGVAIISIAITIFSVAPMVGVLSTSVNTRTFWEFPPHGFSVAAYQAFFADSQLVHSSFVSIEAALFVAVAATAVGTAIAMALTRSLASTRVRSAISIVVLVPLLVPAIAIGISIYDLYLQYRVQINVVTLGLAQMILILPLISGLLVVGFGGIQPNVERAAANLGAQPLHVFWRVTMPLLRPALVTAAILAFVRSFDDTAIALFVNSPTNTTLPVRMLAGMAENPGAVIAATGSFLLLFAAALGVILDRAIGLARAFGIREQRDR